MKTACTLLLFVLFITSCNEEKPAEGEITKEQEHEKNNNGSGVPGSEISRPHETSFGSPYKILPADESATDITLANFLKALKEIVQNKDTARLSALMDPGFITSYGGNISGIPAFKKHWQLNRNERSELWPLLENHLRMGGVFEPNKTTFCLPYAATHQKLPETCISQQTAVCINSMQEVYKFPKFETEETGKLTYDIVTANPMKTEKGFTKIVTLDSTIQGYVPREALYFVDDYKLTIEKQNGQWKLVSLAPFD